MNIYTVIAWVYFLAPVAASLFFVYTLVDLFIYCICRLIFKRNDYEEEVEEDYIETDSSYKDGISVVNTFSDTFKLPTVHFED